MSLSVVVRACLLSLWRKRSSKSNCSFYQFPIRLLGASVRTNNRINTFTKASTVILSWRTTPLDRITCSSLPRLRWARISHNTIGTSSHAIIASMWCRNAKIPWSPRQNPAPEQTDWSKKDGMWRIQDNLHPTLLFSHTQNVSPKHLVVETVRNPRESVVSPL